VREANLLGEPADDSESASAESGATVFRRRVDSIIGRNFWRFFVGGFLGFYVCIELYRRHLGILRAPAVPLIVATAAGIALGLLLPRRRVWVLAEMGPDSLRLCDLRKQTEVIPWEQIRLIVGEAGVSFDGGEILLWKWVRITTPQRDIRLQMHEQSHSCYTALLQHARNALGISYADEVHLPLRTARTSMATAEHIALVRSEFDVQTRRAAFWAVASLVASAAATILVVLAWKNAPETDHDSLAKATVAVIVLAVLVPLLGGFALKRWLGGRRVIRKIREISAAQRHPHTPHHWTVATV
jgi:hypothetical protein